MIWLLALAPFVAFGVASVFGARLLVLARRQRSLATFAWGFAILQFGLGSLALSIGVVFGWTPALFRAYYLFGAVSNVVWLGMGTVWLLAPKTVALVVNTTLGAMLLLAAMSVCTAALPESAAEELLARVPRAALVIPVEVRFFGRWLPIIGTALVVAGLALSMWRRRMAGGLAVLTLGVLVAGAASEFARQGIVAVFGPGLVVAIVLMQIGFVWSTKPPRVKVPRAEVLDEDADATPEEV